MIASPKIETVALSRLKPAPYNPRRIKPEQFENLKKSLLEIGCVVPILANRSNGIIIAGHQRTKAMKAVGMESAPVFFVDGIRGGDEMKFNQLHNGTEIRSARQTTCDTSGVETGGFVTLPAGRFTVGESSASAVKEICQLIMNYGNVLSCVVCGGKVYLGHAYVKACTLLRIPVNAYVADAGKEDAIRTYFGKDYGEYCYDTIERHTYVQGLAQMHRTIESKHGERINRSRLYAFLYLPYLAKHDGKDRKILDFGCGKAVYIDELRRKGYRYAQGLEFFNHNTVGILVGKGHAMIDALIKALSERGLFDDVICDSVLNSVDSMEAEVAVLRCLSTFWNGKGGLFVSGRNIDFVLDKQNTAKSCDKCQYIKFIDDDGFTAQYRQGNWFFQHFHTRETLDKSLAAAGLRVAEWDSEGSAWRCRCERTRELTPDEKRKAVEFEFNLPLPNGKRYGRHSDVLSALKSIGAL